MLVYGVRLLFFFFSSRRRHTRLQGDWSSDVCSSDLGRRRSFRRLSKTDSVKARKNDDRERDMRMPIIALFVIAAALLGETQVSNAQSPYSYPWCAIYSGGRGLGGAMSCYYTSWEQCRAWQARKLHLYAALLLFGRVVAMQHT